MGLATLPAARKIAARRSHWFIYAFVVLPVTYLLFENTETGVRLGEKNDAWGHFLRDLSWAHFSLQGETEILTSLSGAHRAKIPGAEIGGIDHASRDVAVPVPPALRRAHGDYAATSASNSTLSHGEVQVRNPFGDITSSAPVPASSTSSLSGNRAYCKLLAEASTYGLIDFSIFEPDYCSRPHESAGTAAMIDTNSIDCTRLMEFLYLTRGSTKRQILQEKELFQKDVAKGSESDYPLVMYVNRVAMFVTAHAHIVGAIISQRDECFSEQVRLLFVVNLRRFKTLVSEQFRIIWLAYQGVDPEGYCMTEKCNKRGTFAELVENWTGRVVKLLDSDLKTFKSVLETWRPPLPEEAHFYSHETDGRFTTLEMLRRATFNEWFVDTGMLRAALRGGVFPVGATVADLGAGTGEYARWLNDTGLVDAYSFDGSADIELLTKKKVKHLNLVTSIRRAEKHNWVLLLEICEHIPAELHPIFFQNVNAFAGDGIVLSWAPPQIPNIGHTNPLLEQDVRQVLQRFLPLFAVDQDATSLLRAHSQVGWLKNTVTVLRRYPENMVGEVEAGCLAEEHVMYAGEDEAVLDNTDAPQKCCDACGTNPDCKYWVWSHSQRTCWLKRTKEYQTDMKGFLSGSKKGTTHQEL